MSPPCLQGVAQALPFPDQSVDLVVFMTTLEFANHPLRALEEAVRVGREDLILGVLNHQSLLRLRYQASDKSLWQAAHFFTVRELKELARQAAKGRLRSIRWRTTIWPLPFLQDLPLPWGGFIGMAIQLGENNQEENHDSCLCPGQSPSTSPGSHLALS
jgi:SAM-dependent methyltransferase